MVGPGHHTTPDTPETTNTNTEDYTPSTYSNPTFSTTTTDLLQKAKDLAQEHIRLRDSFAQSAWNGGAEPYPQAFEILSRLKVWYS
jgi:hypothetical protein